MSLKRAFALSIDFSKTNHINTSIKFKQFDYGGNEIGLQILYDGDVIVLDDTDVVMAVYRDSKNNIIVDNNCRPVKSFARVYDLNKGLIIMPVNRDVLKLAGKVDVELMITSSDGAKRITSPRFDFEVIQSILDFKEDDIQTRETVCGLYKCGEVLCGRTVEKTSKIYTKNIWIDGQTVIDAEKLNNIENGIESLNSRMDEDKSYIEENFSPKSHRHSAGDIDEQITAVRVNGETYSQVDGVITLPDYPVSIEGSNNASDIAIKDTNNNFKSENVEDALAEVSSQIKDIETRIDNIGGSEGNIQPITQVEPGESDMPKVFFYGSALPTTKNNVNLTMDYVSNTTKFSSFVKLKCQGTSSMNYAKKNFTVAMYSDEARETKLKKDFKGWGAQSKFCLKANYVDTTHTRNLSGARIAYDMVASRPVSEFKQQLLTAPRGGAVDGFPIKLYFNGEFYGIYTWNIPKDGWMFNMDSSNPNHIVLCAEKNTDGNSSLINSCQFRKLWDGSDGGDWSYEFGTPSDTVKNSLNRCIGFVMNATDQEFHDNISEYFDLYSLLDYYCFSYLTCHLDGLAKNMLMVTYDGVHWGACLYDMDSIYGVHWNGNSYVTTNYQCPEQYLEQFSLLWKRIEECFGVELYARYLELRQGALSLSNIIKHVEEIYDVIPDRVFADEKAKWTNLPQVANNTMTRFRNYMRDRAVYVDAQMLEIGTKVACTGITLSANNLSFTTTDTQTLTATVQPTNTTDVVTWSVSPTGVVRVNNGVVTPIKNGTCTITATCGTQSATCNVTVSGLSESGGSTGEDDILSNYLSIYTLENEIVGDGSSVYVDTGIPLMSSEYVSKDWTILVDYTPNTIATDGGVTWTPIVHCMREVSPYNGISFDVGDTKKLRTMLPNNFVRYAYDGTISTNSAIRSGVRVQFVVTKSGNTFTVYNKTMTQTGANTPATINQHDGTLLLMAYQTTDGTKGRFNDGTLHRFALVEGVVSTEDCQAWINNASTGGGTQGNLVFQVNSASMNTADNTLTDNIAGISATLVGNPTVSGNQIAFTANDTFNFNISSLNLTSSNRTVRIKFTPTTLDSSDRNVIIIGNNASNWSYTTSGYISNTKLILQHGRCNFTNNTIGSSLDNYNGNRLSTAPVTGQEYELVISENIDGNIRWYIDGILVQDGTTVLNNPLYISNIEGSSRFIGKYSLIEIYNGYCGTYEDFTNMVNA